MSVRGQPTIRYGGVSRAKVLDLIRAGVPLAQIVKRGGPSWSELRKMAEHSPELRAALAEKEQ